MGKRTHKKKGGVAASKDQTATEATPVEATPVEASPIIQAEASKPNEAPLEPSEASSAQGQAPKPDANPEGIISFSFHRKHREVGNELNTTSDEHKKDCIMCSKPGTMACSRCQQAKYCSRECQMNDWQLHKQFCKTFAGNDGTPARPSPDHHRFLFFPAYTNKPRLIWAKSKARGSGEADMVVLQHEDIAAFIEKTGITPSTSTCIFPTDNRPRKVCGFQHRLVFIMLRDDEEHRITDANHVNRSINGLAQPGLISPLMGPVIAFASDDLECSSDTASAFVDMDPRYIRHVADFFYLWDQNACVPFPKRVRYPILPAMKLSDLSEPFNVAMGITETFQPVWVPEAAPFGGPQQNYPMTLAFMVGLTWYIRQASPRAVMESMAAEKRGHLPRRWKGPKLLWLGNCVALIRKEEGDFDMRFLQSNHLVGSAIFVHGKGAALHHFHVDALDRYLDDVYKKRMAPTKEGFAEFWTRYVEKCVGLGIMEAGKEPKSPYELEEGSEDILGCNTEYVASLIKTHPRQIWAGIVGDMKGEDEN
ncbi:hypothetical protein B0H67DRAFT_549299 [Lasiosphaeris hirsuta]|uniref:MYND-type domain-containing protein n=1 Tax=Lasiosphaeris hirsuta TaxID=260670 RepID=A0AA40BCR7_9PEZI|nr:hypothetical protein B0H67DRAFT_549299 [Lasiosphaeris hirsuta]